MWDQRGTTALHSGEGRTCYCLNEDLLSPPLSMQVRKIGAGGRQTSLGNRGPSILCLTSGSVLASLTGH